VKETDATAPFRIIFEDQHLLVLSKSAGLLSQGDISGEENLVDLLRAHFGRNYVGLIHRLDRNTSGLMVVAKRSKSAERLSEQLKDGKLIRQYHAILAGTLQGEHRWEHWLLKNEKTNEVRTVPAKTASAKLSALRVTALKNFSHPQTQTPLTLARFELETGRSHQIRVQSAASGHPLIGDQKYGTVKSSALFARPALHSSYLSFDHPITHANLAYEERYAADMLQIFSTELE
jgi:23S rRNA pseudouridine1911/1915/1917 synthase